MPTNTGISGLPTRSMITNSSHWCMLKKEYILIIINCRMVVLSIYLFDRRLFLSIVLFLFINHVLSLVMRNRVFIYAKTKTQISFAVTAKLISAFIFATRIVQSLYYLNPKFQVSSHLPWLYRPVCVGPGRKPRILVFSERGSYDCR